MKKNNIVIHNQKGLIFPYAFMMILMACAFTLSQILTGLQTLEYIQKRSKSYLCLKSINLITKEHIRYMNLGNGSILIALALEAVPYTTAVGKAMNKMAKATQQIFYISYMNNLLKIQNCSKKTKALYVYKYPYKLTSGIYLQRDFIGLTQLKKNKWKTYIVTKRYLLQTKWQVKNSFIPQSNLQTKEIGLDYY